MYAIWAICLKLRVIVFCNIIILSLLPTKFINFLWPFPEEQIIRFLLYLKTSLLVKLFISGIDFVMVHVFFFTFYAGSHEIIDIFHGQSKSK